MQMAKVQPGWLALTMIGVLFALAFVVPAFSLANQAPAERDAQPELQQAANQEPDSPTPPSLNESLGSLDEELAALNVELGALGRSLGESAVVGELDDLVERLEIQTRRLHARRQRLRDLLPIPNEKP